MELQQALYLIPVGLSDAPYRDVMPAGNVDIIRGIRHFIVENLREARRFLRRCDASFPIDDCEFHELNTRTDRTGLAEWLHPIAEGKPMGLLSDAGCPAVADPGADIVALAQKMSLRVIPLVGPSSILLALMASGFNGQGFAFNGYLPIERQAKEATIDRLEHAARSKGITQIFIETPYRNNSLVELLAARLMPDTLLCVAADITDPQRENIRTMPAKAWKNATYDYDKHPAIFLIHSTAHAPAAARKGQHKK